MDCVGHERVLRPGGILEVIRNVGDHGGLLKIMGDCGGHEGVWRHGGILEVMRNVGGHGEP